MDAFMFQLLPDLAFRDVVQSMEPMDIFHVTQTSQKTRCLMSRNARLPITVDVSCRFGQYVRFAYCGRYNQSIRFEVNPRYNGPHSRLYKFGKDQKDWSETSYYDSPRESLETHWLDTLHGYKTIINYLADTFNVKSISFNGGKEGSYDVLQHIIDRKLPVQKLEWDSEHSTVAVVRSIFEMATLAKEFGFSTPRDKQIQFTHFSEYSLDSVEFSGAHWITRDGLYALNNCLKVKVTGTQLTGTDLNHFLKHLIRNTGRAKTWGIRSRTEFDMKTVFDGIKYEEIQRNSHIFEEDFKDYIIEREDGLMMKVKYRPPLIGTRNPQYYLKVKVLDPLGFPRSNCLVVRPPTLTSRKV